MALFGDFIEDTIDEAMALFGAEGFGEVDGLVKNDRRFDFGAIFKFKSRQAQNGAFDRVNAQRGPIKERLEHCVERLDVIGDATKELVKQLDIESGVLRDRIIVALIGKSARHGLDPLGVVIKVARDFSD
jgi:hypothetical protein